jgi:hypothetical protein
LAVRSLPSSAGSCRGRRSQIKTLRDCEEDLEIKMARIVLGSGPMEQARG